MAIFVASLLPAPAFADDREPTSPPQPFAEQTGNPFVYGIASHPWWLDSEVYGDQLFAALDDLNVTTVRLPIDWRRFEPEQGVFDWRLYDDVFGELAKRNIVIVANFNTIPGWASVDKEGCDDSATEIYLCELREDMYGAFENAARAAVTRYAWIEHWEFWNEPEMWQRLGRDATVYLRNLRIFYDVAHEVNPEVVVAAQTLVGPEYMEYVYNIAASWYGPGNEPWDAISIHPYNWSYVPSPGSPPEELSYWRIQVLRQLMIDRGDADQPIWITEYGWNHAEEHQARNLVAAIDWMKRQPYIEFAHLHMLHDWNAVPDDYFGLMELLPDENGYRFLGPHTQFAPKPIFYNAFKNLDRSGLPAAPWNQDAAYFPETGHAISGRFLTAWHARGGLRIIGLPLTRPYARQQSDGSWLLVQDFERARLEFHQEYLGQWGEVLGTRVGSDNTTHRRHEQPFLPVDCTPTADRDCFVETGHSLAFGFRSFWQQHGGLATFGYPISEEFIELNPDTGQFHTVQYFERARFEYHPEHAGTEFEVLLGLLIRDDLQAAGWLWPPANSLLPTARSFDGS